MQTVDVAPGTINNIQKLIKSEMFGRRQLNVLNMKLNDLDKRLQKCKENGMKSHRYMLKQRKKVTESVRNMYGIYVRRKMMAVARVIISNFSNSLFGTSTSPQNNSNMDNSESRNGSNVEQNLDDSDIPMLISLNSASSIENQSIQQNASDFDGHSSLNQHTEDQTSTTQQIASDFDGPSSLNQQTVSNVEDLSLVNEQNFSDVEGPSSVNQHNHSNVEGQLL